jgi:hypothetical protein
MRARTSVGLLQCACQALARVRVIIIALSRATARTATLRPKVVTVELAMVSKARGSREILPESVSVLAAALPEQERWKVEQGSAIALRGRVHMNPGEEAGRGGGDGPYRARHLEHSDMSSPQP